MWELIQGIFPKERTRMGLKTFVSLQVVPCITDLAAHVYF